jgi:hypothetical protein
MGKAAQDERNKKKQDNPAPRPGIDVPFLDRHAGHQWAVEPIGGTMALSIWNFRLSVPFLMVTLSA